MPFWRRSTASAAARNSVSRSAGWEAIGGYRHITGADDAQALRLLDVFLTQKPARLASQGLPNVFAGREIRAFLAELATTRDASGNPALELHGIELTGGEHAGAIIAVAGLTIKDRHVTCQFGSIDEHIAADASAGELLFYRMIERMSCAGHKVFDFRRRRPAVQAILVPAADRTGGLLCSAQYQGSARRATHRRHDPTEADHQDLTRPAQGRGLAARASGAQAVSRVRARLTAQVRRTEATGFRPRSCGVPEGSTAGFGVISSTFLEALCVEFRQESRHFRLVGTQDRQHDLASVDPGDAGNGGGVRPPRIRRSTRS